LGSTIFNWPSEAFGFRGMVRAQWVSENC
jgi:hypothetical protein